MTIRRTIIYNHESETNDEDSLFNKRINILCILKDWINVSYFIADEYVFESPKSRSIAIWRELGLCHRQRYYPKDNSIDTITLANQFHYNSFGKRENPERYELLLALFNFLFEEFGVAYIMNTMFKE